MIDARTTAERPPEPGPRRVAWATLSAAGALIGIELWVDPLLKELAAVSAEALSLQGWFKLFTAVGLHAGFWDHLLGNLVLLLLVGVSLERRMGWAPVVVVLLGGGLAGSLATAHLAQAHSIGVSGGVYALLGAWLALGGLRRAQLRRPHLPARLWVLAGALLLFDNLRPGIDWIAHAGGGLAGIGIGACLRSGPGTWTPPLARALIALYGVAWVWGYSLYSSGELLPEGLPRYVLVNNRAWEVALSDVPQAELEAWRDRMLEVVAALPDQGEFVDTLATLHHRLGDHGRAVTLERDLSWREERPVFLTQLARFAHAALEAGEELAPLRLNLRVEDPDEVQLALRPLPRNGVELDALCLSQGRPVGLLRLRLPPGAADEASIALPSGLLPMRPGRDGEPELPELRAVAARVPSTYVPGQPASFQYWPLDAQTVLSRPES